MQNSVPSRSNHANCHSVSDISVNEGERPFLIGVAGGTASGKSTVCDRIRDEVGKVLCKSGLEISKRRIVSISQDSFYRELLDDEKKEAAKGAFNFDHPDAYDKKLMMSCLKDIQQKKVTKIPVYDFVTNSRKIEEFYTVYPADVVLFEGILVFYYKQMREMFDMKLFVDADADTRLACRVLRDIEDRGRNLEHILSQYKNLVKPAFEEFCLPTKKFADVIIPRGAENSVAIDLVAQHIIWSRYNNQIISANSNDSCNSPMKKSESTSSGSSFSRSRSNSDSQLR